MGVKERSGTYFRFLIYLIVIILINIAGTTLFFRFDLTENKVYSLSEASRRVVSTLSEPLTINVFFTENLPAPHNNTERYLHDLLEGYAVYANRYFNYRFYNVSPEQGDMSDEAKENQKLATDYGIYPVQIQAVEKDEVKFKRAYMGLVLIHGDIIERIPTITTTMKLEYQLTTAIQKLNNKISALLSLQEKVSVKLFLSSSLNEIAPSMRLDKLRELPTALEQSVKTLNNKNYGKLTFEHLDPENNVSISKMVDKYDILTLSWPSIPQKNIQEGKGSIGMIMEYGGKWANIPLIQIIRLPLIGTRYELVNIEDLEEIINENIESLIGINEDLGYISDHGTLTLRPDAGMRENPTQQDAYNTATNFQSLVTQTYSIKDIDLKDAQIPSGIKSLVIAHPTQQFTDYELFQIDQFLMRGNNLILFLDAFNEIIPGAQPGMPPGYNQPPIYVPLDTGLEKLLDHYGLTINRSYLLDENCYTHERPQAFGGGEQPIYFAPMIKNQFINKDLAFMNNIKGLVAAKISPLHADTKRIKENNLKLHTLFSSTEKSWEMTGMINLNPMAIRPPQADTEQRSFPLAYLLEGEFHSYFTGKVVPEKEIKEESPSKADEAEDDSSDKEQVGEEKTSDETVQKEPAGETPAIDMSTITDKGKIIDKGKRAKLVLIACSEILRNNMLDPQEPTTNSTFIMNLIDYMNDREAIAVMRSKEHSLNPLVETDAGVKTFIKTFNIAGLPILVIACGFVIFLFRQSRKKRIQMMFHV